MASDPEQDEDLPGGLYNEPDVGTWTKVALGLPFAFGFAIWGFATGRYALGVVLLVLGLFGAVVALYYLRPIWRHKYPRS